MRKLFSPIILFFTALANCIFSGCTQTDVENCNNGGNTVVDFKVSNVMSKAIVTNEVFQTAGTIFKVWGNCSPLTGGTIKVFNGTEIKYDGTNWVYNDLQYWFPGFTYTFRAVYPKEVSATLTGTKFTITDFDASSNIDLLVASPKAIPYYSDGRMDPVQLNFRHLLSRITFAVKAARDATITSVKFYGMPNHGDYNEKKWTQKGAKTTEANPYAMIDAPITLSASNPETTLFIGKEIMMLPQLISSGFVLKIEYYYNDDTNQTPHTGLVDMESIAVTLPNGWEAGVHYLYRFTIGAEYILFDVPQVQHWEDAGGGSYNVDIDD